jgi:hypothetical protein
MLRIFNFSLVELEVSLDFSSIINAVDEPGVNMSYYILERLISLLLNTL